MPNTFITLDVPTDANGVGAPTAIGATGHPKTLVLAGAVVGRYVVEGSNDGGRSWDILVDDNDGTQALFTAQNSGARSVDCIVEQVRVRSVRNLATSSPPVITLGAPPSLGPNFFAALDVPATPGMGAPLDLGFGVGPLKTFICRGNVPPGARLVILASMDGIRFDEVVLFTSDQQGTRSRHVMCRYLRVMRAGASGPPPSISIGAEPTQETGGPASVSATSIELTSDEARQNVLGPEEVLYEWNASLSSIGAPQLVAELSGLFGYDGAAGARFRVRVGGTVGAADGADVVTLDISPPTAPLFASGPPFAAPSESTTLVKVTAHGPNAAMRAVVVRFKAALSS